MDALTASGLPEEARPIVERTAHVLGLSEQEVVDVLVAISDRYADRGEDTDPEGTADLWRRAAELLDRSDDEDFADRMAAVFVVGLLGSVEDERDGADLSGAWTADEPEDWPDPAALDLLDELSQGAGHGLVFGRRGGRTQAALDAVARGAVLLALDTPTTRGMAEREGLALEAVSPDGVPTDDVMLRSTATGPGR